MTLPAGTTIGSYEIAAPLGAGGMGEVYRARDTKLGREVALKILPDVFAADPERLARFEREAQVLASLNHPNIAIIHGIEETNGVRALVLELVEGDTLADRTARSRIPIEEALPLARQIAEALEAAHEQGIVHRDLKPANIKVRDDGAVKVLDFGLAKLVDSSGGSTDATLSPTITSPALVTGVGMLLGTAAYMSPEQARGRMASKRADVWAFGCVLYEMLAGTRAFQGEDVADTLAAVLRGEPDWSALPEDLSPALSALIKQCIHRDPRQRVGDMAAVLFTLRTLTGLPGAAQPKTTGSYTRKRLAVLLVLVAVAAAALTSIAWWASSSTPVPRSVARLEITLPDGQTLPTTPTRVLAISPDGETVAYVARQRIHIRPLSGVAKPIPIAGVDNLTYTPGSPTFSPTGDSIVFSSPGDRTLKKIAVTGGAAVTLCPADVPYGISWGPDGILFGQGGGGILRVSPNAGKPTQVVSVDPNELAAFPQMLPDGDSLLFTLATVGAERFTWDEARIVVQSVKTGQRTMLIDGGSNARYVSTGHIVYAVSGLLYARTFDLKRRALGEPVAVVEGIRQGSGSGVLVGSTLPNAAQFDVSAKGTLVYIPGPESVSSLRVHLVLTDRTGKVTPLKVQPGSYQYPRASPVGAQIAYQNDDGREAAIWIYDLAGTASPSRLTFEGNNRYPVWSSDGRSVAFQSDREGDRAIFQQRLDDPAGAAVRLTKPAAGAEHFPESWNGDTLLFSETRDSQVRLNVLSVSKKEVAPFRDVTSSRWPNAAFSRDGRWVAYSVKTANQPREILFVEPFPPTGIKHQVSDGDAHFPAWSPDELFYVDATRRSNRGVGFVRQTVRTKPDFALTSDPQLTPREFLVTAGGIGRSRTYDILPDGQRFIGIDEMQAGGGQAAASPIQVVLNWFEELKQKVPAK